MMAATLVRPEPPLTHVHAVLLEAQQQIRATGWAQGKAAQTTDRICLGQALAIADGTGRTFEEYTDVYPEELCPTGRVFRRYVDQVRPLLTGRKLWCWQDTPKRTVEDVLELLAVVADAVAADIAEADATWS